MMPPTPQVRIMQTHGLELAQATALCQVKLRISAELWGACGHGGKRILILHQARMWKLDLQRALLLVHGQLSKGDQYL